MYILYIYTYYVHTHTSRKLFDENVIPNAVKANTNSGRRRAGVGGGVIANFHIVDNFHECI